MFLENSNVKSRVYANIFKYFPTDTRDQYQIDELIASDGYVYIKIIKGMYELKRSVIILYNKLISHMDPHRYYPVPFTTGI